jgi:hypothetical protein
MDRVGDAVRDAAVEERRAGLTRSRLVVGDRELEEQIDESRGVPLRRPDTCRCPLVREHAPRRLIDAAEVAAELIEDRRLACARRSGEDPKVGGHVQRYSM